MMSLSGFSASKSQLGDFAQLVLRVPVRSSCFLIAEAIRAHVPSQLLVGYNHPKGSWEHQCDPISSPTSAGWEAIEICACTPSSNWRPGCFLSFVPGKVCQWTFLPFPQGKPQQLQWVNLSLCKRFCWHKFRLIHVGRLA